MPYTDKKRASNAAWDAKNLKRMSVALDCDLYAQMRAEIDSTGESANGFIKTAIRNELERRKGK